MPPLEQLALDAIALVRDIRRGCRQIDPSSIWVRGRRRSAAAPELLQQAQDLAAIVGQIVHPLEEVLLEHRSEGLVKLADPPGFGIELEELKSEERRKDVDERWRHLLFGDGGLEHLQETRFLLDVAAPGLLRALPEVFHLPPAQARVDERGRNDRNHGLGLGNMLEQLGLDHRRYRMLGQAGDLHLFARKLLHPHFQVAM